MIDPAPDAPRPSEMDFAAALEETLSPLRDRATMFVIAEAEERAWRHYYRAAWESDPAERPALLRELGSEAALELLDRDGEVHRVQRLVERKEATRAAALVLLHACRVAVFAREAEKLRGLSREYERDLPSPAEWTEARALLAMLIAAVGDDLPADVRWIAEDARGDRALDVGELAFASRVEAAIRAVERPWNGPQGATPAVAPTAEASSAVNLAGEPAASADRPRTDATPPAPDDAYASKVRGDPKAPMRLKPTPGAERLLEALKQKRKSAPGEPLTCEEFKSSWRGKSGRKAMAASIARIRKCHPEIVIKQKPDCYGYFLDGPCT